MHKRLSLLLAPCGLIVVTFLSLLLMGCGKGDSSGSKSQAAQAAPALTIAYSDWPGWLVWEIAKQKGFFKDAGVNAELLWFEYGPSIDAFTAGKVDAVLIVCGDSLKEKPSTIIVLTDYSDGNDMIIGKPGVESIKDLKGKTVGLEQNMVEHILLQTALEQNGLKVEDVKIKDVKTDDTPQTLKSGQVDAIGAWYPISSRTLKEVPGSKRLFTSAQAPGLIYDALQVTRESLATRRDDWKKVVGVWFKCLDFLNDPKTHNEAVEIMAKKIDAKAGDLEKNLKGTHLLDREGNRKALEKRDTLDSVYGSMKRADAFYLQRKVYDKGKEIDRYVDSSLVQELMAK